MSDAIVIVCCPYPDGGFQGDFSSVSASELGAVAVRGGGRAGVSPEVVDELVFGNCLMAGQGQAPARQAAIKGWFCRRR